MTHILVLAKRGLIEMGRTPEALFPTLFIPMFFLIVNVGQAGKIFPAKSTGFLHGQGYAAFTLPSSLLLAASFGSAAATNSGGLIFFPLLFLTPNFVPRNMLTRAMEDAATYNPVTYVMEAMRSLILEDFNWGRIGAGVLVIAIAGVVMLSLSVRMIRNYD